MLLRRLPAGYSEYDSRTVIAPGAPLRDGFNLATELAALEPLKN